MGWGEVGEGGGRLRSVNKYDHNARRVKSGRTWRVIHFSRVCLCVCLLCGWTFLQICCDTKVWRHGRAPRRRASGRAADRARSRGLADGAGGPVQRRDEPQQVGQTAALSAHEDEEAAGLLLQAARLQRTLQTSKYLNNSWQILTIRQRDL